MTETTSARRLAVLGGRPAFEAPLHVGRPNVGDRARILERIGTTLDSGWLTNYGPNVQELERRIAGLTGVEHCVVTCNATLALEILVRAAALSGDVIVPSWTFVATAHALQWRGLTPVFVDVDEQTHNIDPARIEERITARTSAIIGVHLWGRPCDINALAAICQRHGLQLLFDAAHAFGASYRGRRIGGFGHAEVFSFHATKFFNTFEGGAITTNDGELAARIRLMANFGFSGIDEVASLGTNAKMNEIAAAMGLASLDNLESLIATNRQNHRRYAAQLAGIPGLSLLTYDSAERANYQYVVVDVDQAAAHLTRDELVDVLWAENVHARRYFYPGVHRMEPYLHLYPDASQWLPVTERLAGRTLSLPTGTAIRDDDIDKICSILATAVRNSREVHAGLASGRSGNGHD